MNTAFAAKLLAQWAGVGEQAIGYAGLKDRHAVTRQRFSVHLPGRPAPDIDALQVDGLRVLDHAWHAKKLPRGALAGNRFRLVLRGVQGGRAAIDARLRAIAEVGRSEEHTSALQSLMRISYAVFCLQKKKRPNNNTIDIKSN